MIQPKETTVEKQFHLKVLYKDHGWKGNSEFSCKICGDYFSEYAWDEETQEFDYRKAYPKLVEHIVTNHPEYCHACATCNEKFITKKAIKDHLKTHKKPKK